ncbi:MAG: hypothetical protein LBO74_04605 [Candidatus Symbiothrix sp.]|jgi:hypothetical protein|nr:hypothetical protein [Candidatus Symbiothrix sp.]
MKQILFLCVGLTLSAMTMFGQELKVTAKEMTAEVIFREAGDNETVVEVKSNVKLEFESTMDKVVNVYQTYEESGFFFYNLLFSTDKQYDGRKLEIKSYGFDTYTQPLDLKAKVPVQLLVINNTKFKADDFYNAGKFSEALKEYEKVYSTNPTDEYVKSRINQCNEKLTTVNKVEEAKLNFVFRGVEKKKNSSILLYLDNKLIGETNISKGFQFKYTDTKPSAHELRAVWSNLEWKGIINTATQTDFKFEHKKKNTGFGYTSYFELAK